MAAGTDPRRCPYRVGENLSRRIGHVYDHLGLRRTALTECSGNGALLTILRSKKAHERGHDPTRAPLRPSIIRNSATPTSIVIDSITSSSVKRSSTSSPSTVWPKKLNAALHLMGGAIRAINNWLLLLRHRLRRRHSGSECRRWRPYRAHIQPHLGVKLVAGIIERDRCPANQR